MALPCSLGLESSGDSWVSGFNHLLAGSASRFQLEISTPCCYPRYHTLQELKLLPNCLHIVQSANPKCTGICKIITGLAGHVGASRYQIAALFLEDGPLRAEMEAAGILTGVVNWSGGRNAMGILQTWNWLRRHRAQIVHMHLGSRQIQLLARMTGATVVVQHVHSPIVEPDLSSISHFTFRGVDAVVASSRAVADSLCGIRAQVIYAGIEACSDPPPMPPFEGQIRVGVLSRLVPVKRIEAVIEAAAQLAAIGIEMQTEICGEGPSEPQLRDLVDRLGIVDRVRFLGWRTDTSALLAKWHLLVMPSMYEGFPIAALEAMAAGRAVVASRVGGIAELIDDGISGVLIPAGDTDALVVSIRNLALDRPRLLSIGREGWKRVKMHFSNDLMAHETFALYNRLLNT